jgi:hypothetical protein
VGIIMKTTSNPLESRYPHLKTPLNRRDSQALV